MRVLLAGAPAQWVLHKSVPIAPHEASAALRRSVLKQALSRVPAVQSVRNKSAPTVPGTAELAPPGFRALAAAVIGAAGAIRCPPVRVLQARRLHPGPWQLAPASHSQGHSVLASHNQGRPVLPRAPVFRRQDG